MHHLYMEGIVDGKYTYEYIGTTMAHAQDGGRKDSHAQSAGSSI